MSLGKTSSPDPQKEAEFIAFTNQGVLLEIATYLDDIGITFSEYSLLRELRFLGKVRMSSLSQNGIEICQSSWVHLQELQYIACEQVGRSKLPKKLMITETGSECARILEVLINKLAFENNESPD